MRVCEREKEGDRERERLSKLEELQRRGNWDKPIKVEEKEE